MGTLVRVVALPVLVAAAFTASAVASVYWAGLLFPRVVPRPYVEMVSAAAVGALAAALVTAIPLARLYGRYAPLAAVMVSAPWLAVRTSDLIHNWHQNEPRIMVMSWLELVLFPAVIVGSATLAARRRGARARADSVAAPSRD